MSTIPAASLQTI